MESVQLVQLFKDLNHEVDSLIHLAKNPALHALTKHVEVRYHFICEKVLKWDTNLNYVQTMNQVTNSFTKSLPCNKLLDFCEEIGMTCNTSHMHGFTMHCLSFTLMPLCSFSIQFMTLSPSSGQIQSSDQFLSVFMSCVSRVDFLSCILVFM